MSSSEMYMEPKGYESQVESFQSAKETFAALKYAIDNQGLTLDCVDKIVEVFELYEDAMLAMNDLMGLDVESFKRIKANWLHMDEAGMKTVGEHFCDWVSGKK